MEVVGDALSDCVPTRCSTRSVRVAVAVLLTGQWFMLAGLAILHSPTYGEVPALASALWHWETGDFTPFRVNPPLVRMWAAIPVLIVPHTTNWERMHDVLGDRCEFDLGEDFILANGASSQGLFVLARMMCLPLTVLGGWVCWKWASELYGARGGVQTLALWCASPMILGHGALITPDVPAATFGVLAAYCLSRWYQCPTGPRVAALGLTCGAALLTKATWLILLPLCPVLWGGLALLHRSHPGRSRLQEALGLSIALGVALLVVNIGYGLERTLLRLGEPQFVSRSLGGDPYRQGRLVGGNRFAGGWLGDLRIPLPEDFLLGVDIQRRDFEIGEPAYRNGVWQEAGSTDFYLRALGAKTPEPSLVLMCLGIALLIGRAGAWRSAELFVCVPALAVLALVSSQTGLNGHSRYAIPALPFLLILGGSVGTQDRDSRFQRALKRLAPVLIVTSSVMTAFTYPHLISYSNTWSGAGRHLSPVLLGSDCDWNQDLVFLRRWIRCHSRDEDVQLALSPGAVPGAVGLTSRLVPLSDSPRGAQGSGGRSANYLAVSVNRLFGRYHEFGHLQGAQPVARIGHTIVVFDVSRMRVD